MGTSLCQLNLPSYRPLTLTHLALIGHDQSKFVSIDSLVETVQSHSDEAVRARAYDQVIRRLYPRLVSFVGGLGLDPSTAEDIAQDTMVRAFFKIQSYSGRGKFLPWLRTIARRLAYNHLRDSSVRDHYEALCDWSGDMCASSARQTQARDALLKCFESLPEAHREVLVMRYINGLPIKEIGSQLAISQSAAKMRLSRAKQSFEACYQGL